jgi:RNA polymerase sigma-70 factor (ECF subfamily)
MREICREMTPRQLAEAFASVSPARAQRDMDALERELLSRVEAARAAWPDAWIDEASFVRHLARQTKERLPAVERAPDMWLAWACANGAPAAIATLIQRYRGPIERAAARVADRLAEEAAQVVFTSLLVREGDGLAPIAAYGGECSLSTWLATVSARAAIKLCRGQAQAPHDSVSQVTYAAPDDPPELLLLRAKYAPELDVALRAALAALDARQRVLLRLHHVDRWSLERLAGLYEISRATAARWLSAARQALYERTKRHLRERLRVTSGEFASIAALVGVELEVSVVRLLREETAVRADPGVPSTAPASGCAVGSSLGSNRPRGESRRSAGLGALARSD